MDTLSVKDVADQLATSVPRVRRAIERLELVPLTSPAGIRLDGEQFELLRRHLGYAPPEPDVAREAMFLLAALNLRPLGTRSVRSAARAAGISPTAAGRYLRRLVSAGVVVCEPTVAVDAGRATPGSVFRIDRDHPRWQRLAPAVREVRLRDSQDEPDEVAAVPRTLWHHFWNVRPADLRLPEDGDFVAARLLRTNDPRAISWAGTHLPATSIRKVGVLRGIPERDRAWIEWLARARERRLCGAARRDTTQ